MMNIYAGVDEAGRGPVLGPMVMCIVAANQEQKGQLNKLGCKDSKQLTPLKRNKLARAIKQLCAHVIIKVSPQEIDDAVISDTSSLNVLEAVTTAKLINRLNKKTPITSVMIDLPDKNKQRYLETIMNNVQNKNIHIDAQYKADENDVTVAAASIIAKVTRDKSLETQTKKHQLPFVSGYPGDPNTKKALEGHYKAYKQAGLVRRSWKTAKEYEETQITLNNW